MAKRFDGYEEEKVLLHLYDIKDTNEKNNIPVQFCNKYDPSKLYIDLRMSKETVEYILEDLSKRNYIIFSSIQLPEKTKEYPNGIIYYIRLTMKGVNRVKAGGVVQTHIDFKAWLEYKKFDIMYDNYKIILGAFVVAAAGAIVGGIVGGITTWFLI